MSQAYRDRIQQLLQEDQSLGMSDTEKADKLGWCPISDKVIADLIKQIGFNGSIDDWVEQATDAQIKDVHERVMTIYRERQKKKRKKIQAQIKGEEYVEEAETEKVEVES